MFGLSVATELIQGSTERTWNCVLHFVHSLWSKFNQNSQTIMPKSRKRHHSRSRSRSRSHSRDRSRDRDDKYKRNDSHDKERDGKRRKIDSYDSPPTKRSVSEEPRNHQTEEDMGMGSLQDDIQDKKQTGGPAENNAALLDSVEHSETKKNEEQGNQTGTEKANEIQLKALNKEDNKKEHISSETSCDIDIEKKSEIDSQGNLLKEGDIVKEITSHTDKISKTSQQTDVSLCSKDITSQRKDEYKVEGEAMEVIIEPCDTDTLCKDTSQCKNNRDQEKLDESLETIEIDEEETDVTLESDQKSEEDLLPSTQGSTVNKQKLEITPKRYLSPKQIQRKMESEKKRIERQKEKDVKERKKNEERERIMKEKQKKKEEKQRELEQKQKEKEMKEELKQKEKELKEEQKRKEREEKELKRKEKEEKDEQKRKEKEIEKQREEEKKQKAAAAFANFFVSKRSDNQDEEKKVNEIQSSAFMAFEVKSDMKLPPCRRPPLSQKQIECLDNYLNNQSNNDTYLEDLRSGKNIGRCLKTWPYEDVVDDDIEIIEEETKNVGETICEDIKPIKLRAKFLKFHENRRPAYFGTWRKKSKFVKPRKPLAEDTDIFNYEEDSGDDWEEEEQGESLTGSDDEADKENEDEKDDYEVDNEFFVPHGHLSDDEVDDEENKRMSPESMKQKLKLLKDEFDLDMKSKTHKLKPKAIGCIWYKKGGSNVDEAIHKYLQPLAIICRGNIEIKRRSDIFSLHKVKQKKQLNPEVIPLFIKFIHGSENRKKNLFEKFKSYMFENGKVLEFTKRSLLTYLNENASWKKNESGPNKNKMTWIVNADIRKKYNADNSLSNVESDK